jgi:hypothetical protein
MTALSISLMSFRAQREVFLRSLTFVRDEKVDVRSLGAVANLAPVMLLFLRLRSSSSVIPANAGIQLLNFILRREN